MSGDYFHRVQKQTATRFWINNVTREQTKLAIEAGAVGCTQNPSFPYKMLVTDDESERRYVYGILDNILKTEKDSNEAQILLQRALVENIAKAFLPIYEQSGGALGYVSIQGDPFREDTETILKYAKENHIMPNIMVKVPATVDGLEAISYLAAEGIPINATEVMSTRQALDVANVYEKATRGMKNKPVIFFSHISGILDEYLTNYVKENNIEISKDILWQAGIAAAKKAYKMVNDKALNVGFIGGGARGLHHFTEMVGASAAVTINWQGTAEELIKQDPYVVQRFLQPTPPEVIEELCEKIDDFKKAYFTNEINPHEYESFGPVVLFRSMFESAWKKGNEIISKRQEQL